MWQHLVSEPHKGPIRLGWTGGRGHYDDLKTLVAPLRRIFHRFPDVELHIAGLLPDFFKEFAANIREHESVVIQDWPEHLASMGIDIGLAPIVDRPFNLSKSNIKWMEYSMLGIPTVASAVGPYKEPTNILTASNQMEWTNHLTSLINDEHKRRQLGQRARQEVIDNHDARGQVALREKTYRQIIESYGKSN